MKSVVDGFILALTLSNLFWSSHTANNIKWNFNKIQYKRSIDAAVTRYYERKTFMMSIGVNLKYSKLWQNYLVDFLSDALTDSKLMKYEIFMNTKNRFQRQLVAKVSYHNLWYVDSYNAFRSLLVAVKSDYDYSENMGEYVVVMETEKSLNEKREVQLILEKSFEFNIFNIVVAVFVSKATFILYSYSIFKPNNCRQVAVEQVNIFQNGYFHNEELFPYKFNNFHNCPITMYIRNTSLFYRFNLTQDGTRIASIAGVEANMIQAMAEKLNFELRMYYDESDDTVGNVYENGTAVGPFRFLVENKLDVLLGYYHYPARLRYFGESISYAFMPLVIVTREFSKNDFAEVWPFRPYSRRAWLILGLLFFFNVVLVQLCHYYLHKRLTWIDVVGLVLGNSRPLHIKSYVKKVAFFICLFGIMIFCATFQGRLYYAFNSGHEVELTDIQQLIAANYTFFLTRRFNKDLIHSLHIPFKQIQFVDAVNEYMIYEMMLTYSNNVATLTNYWDFQMYIGTKKYNNEFSIIPMIVLLNQICAYVKNKSYLIEPINRIIYSLKFGGILDKWMKDLTNIAKTNECGLSVKYKLSNKPLPLTLSKLKVVFAGLVLFYFLSILVFLGECILKDWKKIVKKFKKIKC